MRNSPFPLFVIVLVTTLSVISAAATSVTPHATGTLTPALSGLSAMQGFPSLRPSDSSISVSLSINPTQVNEGNSITVQTTVSGGTSPYSFSYTGLPDGCQGQDQQTFMCVPSSTGTFNVQVTVTDFHGNQSNPSNSVSLSVSSSSNNGNGNNNNNNGGSNNSSNPFSDLFSGLGGILTLALIFAVVGLVTWILLIVGVWVIAVVLMRRLPKGGTPLGVTMVKCAGCGTAIPGGTKFCPNCGASTAPKA